MKIIYEATEETESVHKQFNYASLILNWMESNPKSWKNIFSYFVLVCSATSIFISSFKFGCLFFPENTYIKYIAIFTILDFLAIYDGKMHRVLKPYYVKSMVS